jgi:hypothetical protein
MKLFWDWVFYISFVLFLFDLFVYFNGMFIEKETVSMYCSIIGNFVVMLLANLKAKEFA